MTCILLPMHLAVQCRFLKFALKFGVVLFQGIYFFTYKIWQLNQGNKGFYAKSHLNHALSTGESRFPLKNCGYRPGPYRWIPPIFDLMGISFEFFGRKCENIREYGNENHNLRQEEKLSSPYYQWHEFIEKIKIWVMTPCPEVQS